jgi:hypothetical protein
MHPNPYSLSQTSGLRERSRPTKIKDLVQLLQPNPAALHAQQCRNVCGLRAASKMLTMKGVLPKAAHANEHEDARYADAREMRETTLQAKDKNAGQPGATQCEAKT